MPYIGVSPFNGVRKKHTYTATASQTSFSGAGAEGITLSYKDSTFVDVFQNGVKLGEADYTSTSGTAIVLAQGASLNDIVEVVVYDVFSVADTVSKADGGTFDNNVSVNGTVEINSTTTSDFLVVKTTEAGSGSAPDIVFARDSSSPADNDFLGKIVFRGKNDASEDVEYAQIISQLIDASDGTEDGKLYLQTKVNGSDTNVAVIDSSGLTVTGNTTLNGKFLIDGSNNDLMTFRTTGDTASQVLGLQFQNNSEAVTAQIFGTGDNSSSGVFRIKGIGDVAIIGGDIGVSGAAGDLVVKSTGVIQMGTTETNVISVDGRHGIVMNDKTNGYYLGVGQFSANGNASMLLNRDSDDGSIQLFFQDAAEIGSITTSGSTVSYNAFSGSHWSRLTDNSKPTILKGTVIETIDEMCDWYQAEFTVVDEVDEKEVNRTAKDSIALPNGKSVGDTITHTFEGKDYTAKIIKEEDNKHTKCKISDTADSKRVYGVYAAWDNDDDTVNDMYVTAVGTHVVRINKDVTVSAGDLLSSNGDGTAKVQDDDIIRSKTIGKVLTNIKQETYSDGSYTVPCALYCG
jgi:hypothetical protein